jgi:ribonuclease HI
MLEKTYCALAWVARRLCQYMLNHTTWLISKMDPIKYIFENLALIGRIACWQMLLSEYDIEYHTQKAIKRSILADHLAHQPIDDYQSIKFDFSDEDVMYLKAKYCDEPFPNEGPEPGSHWGLTFDGVVNAYSNGIGAIIVTPCGRHIPFTVRLTFNCTNNMAEYEACIMGLEEAIDLRIKILDVYGDSTLVINQIKGEWETRQPGLIPYKDYARRLSTFFNEIELHHIPREENQMEYALATLSSMIVVNRWNDVPKIDVMRLDITAHVFLTKEVKDDKSWYHDIKFFIQKQEYPPEA